MLKKDYTGFSMEYSEKVLVFNNDSAIQLLIPKKLQKMKQHQ